MTRTMIGIVGDFNPLFEPHAITNELMRRASTILDHDIHFDWLPSLLFVSEERAQKIIQNYDGFWISPGSPYHSLDGILRAIRIIRENNLPAYGTCAGCQHMMLEYVQNVVGEKHASSDQYQWANGINDILSYPYPANERLSFISRIACPIAGTTLEVRIKKNTLAHDLYQTEKTREKYYCTFGPRSEFNKSIEEFGGVISASDDSREARIFEVPSQRFYIGTLFVPQLDGPFNPILKGFLITSIFGKEKTALHVITTSPSR